MENIFNRLELILGMTDYDFSFQPLKKYGLYIYWTKEFFLYGAGEMTENRLMNFVENIVNYRIKVIHPNDKYHTKRYFHNDYDYLGANDFIIFDFFVINENEEHLLIPYLNDKDCTIKSIQIAYTIDDKILTINETKTLLAEEKRQQYIKKLESVANWRNSLKSNTDISNFANEYFGRNCTDIKKKYRELAKVHHPDKGGDELMFKAITRTREYLETKFN